MADVFTKKKRSEVMSFIHSKNTKPELKLRKLLSSALYPQGYRYRIHYKKLPGNPDIAFVSQKIAIFVDGNFWHGYNLKTIKTRLPKKYWVPKIERNIKRDKEINLQLKKLGWKVVRVWDHDVYKAPDEVLQRIFQLLDSKK